jgi:putative flavoprotein involved in K+ transport
MTAHDSKNHDYVPVIIIGAGQAGLSMSYHLTARQIKHLVLERFSAGHAWREQRWDSFCLVTPNWQCRLPGHPYNGSDPDGFMVKDEIVKYLDDYVALIAPPLHTGVEVRRISRSTNARFQLETSQGTYTTDHVVMCTGGYHEAHLPAMSQALDPEVTQLNAATYKNAHSLPDGAVLVVGSGQSGCQIAEDLHLAGRQVHLCTGSAPRVARRYRGRDVVWWLDRMGHYDMPIDKHPDGEAVRKKHNHYVTGRDGGRDIDLRKFAKEGMQLHGRLLGIDAQGFQFGSDLEQNLDGADATDNRIKNNIDTYIERENISAPEEARYSPLWKPNGQPTRLDPRAANIRSVVWCIGFGIDYSYVELPVFDSNGYPMHKRGVTPEPGLYFLGLPWLNTWGSGRFVGVGADAEHLAQAIQSCAAQTVETSAAM